MGPGAPLDRPLGVICVETFDFGVILDPLWLLWAVNDIIHLQKVARRDSIGKTNRKTRFSLLRRGSFLVQISLKIKFL